MFRMGPTAYGVFNACSIFRPHCSMVKKDCDGVLSCPLALCSAPLVDHANASLAVSNKAGPQGQKRPKSCSVPHVASSFGITAPGTAENARSAQGLGVRNGSTCVTSGSFRQDSAEPQLAAATETSSGGGFAPGAGGRGGLRRMNPALGAVTRRPAGARDHPVGLCLIAGF